MKGLCFACGKLRTLINDYGFHVCRNCYKSRNKEVTPMA